jgi:type II secretory pathway pseudopilin PulG
VATEGVLEIVVGVVLLAVLAMLIFRAFLLWYWRVNDAVNALQGIERALWSYLGDARVGPLQADGDFAEVREQRPARAHAKTNQHPARAAQAEAADPAPVRVNVWRMNPGSQFFVVQMAFVLVVTLIIVWVVWSV